MKKTKYTAAQICQLIIVCGLMILLVMALIVDGKFGETVFGLTMTTLGVVLGYFFRKANEK